jgi:hypothetical protein
MTAFDQISGDLSWRESELGSLKILLSRPDITKPQREVLLRASWAMLYAHYEGFVKTSLTVFYEEAKKRVAGCGHLPKETRISALVSIISRIRSLPAGEFLEEIEGFEKKYYTTSPEFREVETKSNLWPNLLVDLLKEADIENEIVEVHRHKLKTLVARRNQIAHGKQDIIAEVDYYFEYEKAVYDLMYELTFRIDERLNSPPYAIN